VCRILKPILVLYIEVCQLAINPVRGYDYFQSAGPRPNRCTASMTYGQYEITLCSDRLGICEPVA